ncbi:hypothetical protein LR48_Vigan08g081600 [Vigna angularis]|uniref:Uncharacterized protein n=1 Tax=Phaseolus angularis TaxID=3914 RepID=A0A0L9V5Q6_PHAAN|nr:hypothetical protein LR48_Vigan08g081600 [Vigna angularis]
MVKLGIRANWALCEWLGWVALCLVIRMANQGTMHLLVRPGLAMREVEVCYLLELIRIPRQIAMRVTPSLALRIGCVERMMEVLVLRASSMPQGPEQTNLVRVAG